MAYFCFTDVILVTSRVHPPLRFYLKKEKVKKTEIAKLYMNCFGCTVCHFCLSYVNTEVKVSRVQKDFEKEKGGYFVSSCTSLTFGIKVLAASGSLLQLLGSLIFSCLSCLYYPCTKGEPRRGGCEGRKWHSCGRGFICSVI